MSREPINNWVNKAKNSQPKSGEVESVSVNVVRREPPQSKGAMIMEIADRIWPSLMEFFSGKRDDNGMLLQPAHVRGFALAVAQNLMKQHESQSSD